jgi:hypothetical protein
MPTLADPFKTCYLTGGSGVEFSAIRLDIFESLPDHVEQEGTLVALRQWHDSSLRDLCFGELFSLRRTSATRILASAVRRRFGVPSPDIEALRNG